MIIFVFTRSVGCKNHPSQNNSKVYDTLCEIGIS